MKRRSFLKFLVVGFAYTLCPVKLPVSETYGVSPVVEQLERLRKELEEALFYGDGTQNPKLFTGLAVRRSTHLN